MSRLVCLVRICTDRLVVGIYCQTSIIYFGRSSRCRHFDVGKRMNTSIRVCYVVVAGRLTVDVSLSLIHI